MIYKNNADDYSFTPIATNFDGGCSYGYGDCRPVPEEKKDFTTIFFIAGCVFVLIFCYAFCEIKKRHRKKREEEEMRQA